MSVSLQCVDKFGTTFLALMRFRTVMEEGSPEIGCMFSILPLPGSKYIFPAGDLEASSVTMGSEWLVSILLE